MLDRPPKITFPFAGSTAIANSSSSVTGAHGNKSPAGVAAAIRDRATAEVPTDKKFPPKYTEPAVAAIAYTNELGCGLNAFTVHDATSIAAIFFRKDAPTFSNNPPIYTVPPSGDTATARTNAADVPRVTSNTQPVGTPDAASNTAKFDRLTDPASPSTVPGGRNAVNVPPANTFPCADAKPHTVPFVCHVGNASAVNRNDGANAPAGNTTHNDNTKNSAVPNAASLRMYEPAPQRRKRTNSYRRPSEHRARAPITQSSR